VAVGFPDRRRRHSRFIGNQYATYYTGAADGMWHIVNDGSAERPTPTNQERRAWPTLRACRVLKSLAE
jgi:hypothetical protein